MNENHTGSLVDQSVGKGEISFVVGIGASAGGIEALGELVEALPSDTGMAFIFVLHLDPQHESMLEQIFQRRSSVPVQQAADGMVMRPDHIYLIPPNKYIGITDGKLVLALREKDGARFMPIDAFFTSLAGAWKNRAIGVILSGTGNDGTQGLTAIKKEGGFAFVQDTPSALFPDMPKNAIASGAADFILPPGRIATELARIGKNPLILEQPRQQSKNGEEDRDLLKIFRVLQRATGIDFSNYKTSTIQRRIARRMMIIRIESISDYVAFLEKDPAEVEALSNDLFINVTSFFRDGETFDFLREQVLPELLNKISPSTPLRVWVPGCSTGEEVYSLAICLLEAVGENDSGTMIQIFATDISDRVIARARAGCYPESIAADLTADRLNRFFTRSNGGYQVSKSIRDLCIFSRHDLTRDPPFSRMDLISCRNLLIYLAAPQQQRIISTFHYALNPDGILVLGSSESVGSFANLFTPIVKKHKVYRKKQAIQYTSHDFLPPVHREEKPVSKRILQLEATAFDVQKAADRILLTTYAPASILVNDHLDIIQFRGNTGRFVEPTSGAATLNLMKMLQERLLLEVRSLISGARKQNVVVRRNDIPVTIGGETILINVDVVPVRSPDADAPGFFLIIFMEPSSQEERVQLASPALGHSEPEQEQLRHDLHATREYLQSALEEKDAMNEEFRSAIEEIQSSNEELQSTNEELETTKEELQSTNEELMTVNEEMQNRNAELTRINDDLTNLLNNVSLPLVILTSDLRIRRYTAMAQNILNLIPADVGRPFSDLRTKIALPDLEGIFHDVLENLAPRELEVSDSAGRWHRLRIRPYTTHEKKIDGVVLTLLDIDDMKRTLEGLQQSRNFAEAVIQTVREPLLVLDEDLRVSQANQAFYKYFQVTAAETDNNYIYNLGSGQWNIPELRRLLDEILPYDTSFSNFEIEHEFPRLGKRRLLLNARKVHGEASGAAGKILLAIEENNQGTNHG